MRDWILAWTIIGSVVALGLFSCISYELSLDLKEKDLAFKAGLQQCQNFGRGDWSWRKECR